MRALVQKKDGRQGGGRKEGREEGVGVESKEGQGGRVRDQVTLRFGRASARYEPKCKLLERVSFSPLG